MELERDTELEEVYRELLESGFREHDMVLGRTVLEYITDMKLDALREEMDYFVSYCLEFGVNLSRIQRQGDGFTYDYYTFVGEQLHHAGMVLSTPQVMYPHRHDYYELVYVLSGKLKHRIADQELTLYRDDMLLLDLNTVHAEYVDDESVVQYLQLPEQLWMPSSGMDVCSRKWSIFSQLMGESDPMISDIFIWSTGETRSCGSCWYGSSGKSWEDARAAGISYMAFSPDCCTVWEQRRNTCPTSMLRRKRARQKSCVC